MTNPSTGVNKNSGVHRNGVGTTRLLLSDRQSTGSSGRRLGGTSKVGSIPRIFAN
jgi:hypothetical protein